MVDGGLADEVVHAGGEFWVFVGGPLLLVGGSLHFPLICWDSDVHVDELAVFVLQVLHF